MTLASALRHIGSNPDPDYHAQLMSAIDHWRIQALGNVQATNAFVLPLDGDKLQLMAVSDLSSGTPMEWLPDGTPVGKLPVSMPGGLRSPRSLALTVALPGSKASATVVKGKFSRKNLKQVASLYDGMPYLPYTLGLAGKPVAPLSWACSENNEFILFRAGGEAVTLDFRVGAPAGPWQDVYVGWVWNGKIPKHSARTFDVSGQSVSVRLNQVSDDSPQPGLAACWYSQSFPSNWVGRLVAVDDSGAIHFPDGNMYGWTMLEDLPAPNQVRVHALTFGGLASSRVREFRFQIRPCQWQELKDISLQPGHLTEVSLASVPPGTSLRSRASDTNIQR